MPIKPIDLQTNMSQVIEVGRNEHARSEAGMIQQQGMEKDSSEKARLVNTKLDETKKSESAVIRNDENKRERGKRRARAKGESVRGGEAVKTAPGKAKDERMGRIIDILK